MSVQIRPCLVDAAPHSVDFVRSSADVVSSLATLKFGRIRANSAPIGHLSPLFGQVRHLSAKVGQKSVPTTSTNVGRVLEKLNLHSSDLCDVHSGNGPVEAGVARCRQNSHARAMALRRPPYRARGSCIICNTHGNVPERLLPNISRERAANRRRSATRNPVRGWEGPRRRSAKGQALWPPPEDAEGQLPAGKCSIAFREAQRPMPSRPPVQTRVAATGTPCQRAAHSPPARSVPRLISSWPYAVQHEPWPFRRSALAI